MFGIRCAWDEIALEDFLLIVQGRGRGVSDGGIGGHLFGSKGRGDKKVNKFFVFSL